MGTEKVIHSEKAGFSRDTAERPISGWDIRIPGEGLCDSCLLKVSFIYFIKLPPQGKKSLELAVVFSILTTFCFCWSFSSQGVQPSRNVGCLYFQTSCRCQNIIRIPLDLRLFLCPELFLHCTFSTDCKGLTCSFSLECSPPPSISHHLEVQTPTAPVQMSS